MMDESDVSSNAILRAGKAERDKTPRWNVATTPTIKAKITNVFSRALQMEFFVEAANGTVKVDHQRTNCVYRSNNR